jgi:hypothetical protein
LGIYSSTSGIDTPGARLLDAGTVAVTSTGWKSITISQSLTAGTYWLVALQVTGSTGGVFTGTANTSDPIMPFTTIASPSYLNGTPVCFYQSSQTSLPATFTISGLNAVTPMIWLGF